MEYISRVGRAIYSVGEFYQNINPSTLTGAIDVVVIEDPSGYLSCSPFHVRFGKLQLLRPQDKIVDIYVNDMKVNIDMKVGEAGEAFFVVKTFVSPLTSDYVPEELITSPVLRPTPMSEPPDIELLDLSKGIKSSADNISGLAPESPSITNVSEKFSQLTLSEPFLNIQPTADLASLQDDTLPSNPTDPISGLAIDTNYSSLKNFENEQTSKTQQNLTNYTQSLNQSHSTINFSDTQNAGGSSVEMNSERSLTMPDLSIPTTTVKENLPSGTDTNHKTAVGQLSNDALNSTSTASPKEPKYIKSLRLSNECLQELHLKPGPNNVTFVAEKGTCSSRIFLWRHDVQIVVSDIDGTITRSDVFGHLFTIVGKDWTQIGVARLFTKITQNGYKIIYLTSRALGQADSTRYYLRGIEQDRFQLPDGPVIMSPDRLFTAIHREVIMRKPEEFKMACLKDIKRLFPSNIGKNPFYAGFGNRTTDSLSYRSVSIPVSRIFTIDSYGEIRLDLMNTFKASYFKLSELADLVFPPCDSKGVLIGDDDFSDASFWKNTYVPPSKEVIQESKRKEIVNKKLMSATSPALTDASLVFGQENLGGLLGTSLPSDPSYLTTSTAMLGSEDMGLSNRDEDRAALSEGELTLFNRFHVSARRALSEGDEDMQSLHLGLLDELQNSKDIHTKRVTSAAGEELDLFWDEQEYRAAFASMSQLGISLQQPSDKNDPIQSLQTTVGSKLYDQLIFRELDLTTEDEEDEEEVEYPYM